MLPQMAKLDRFIECRRDIAKRYDRAFGSLPGCIVPASDPGHGYHLYAFRVPTEIRAELFEHLRANDIWVQVHYPPVHLHPYYRRTLGYVPGDFPVAERFYSMQMSLPIYVGLSEQDQDRVISLIADRLTQ